MTGMTAMWIAVGVWAVIVIGGVVYGFLSAKADTFISRCHGCGQGGLLRYRHIKSGVRYCSQECVEKDPNWPDEEMWVNA